MTGSQISLCTVFTTRHGRRVRRNSPRFTSSSKTTHETLRQPLFNQILALLYVPCIRLPLLVTLKKLDENPSSLRSSTLYKSNRDLWPKTPLVTKPILGNIPCVVAGIIAGLLLRKRLCELNILCQLENSPFQELTLPISSSNSFVKLSGWKLGFF